MGLAGTRLPVGQHCGVDSPMDKVLDLLPEAPVEDMRIVVFRLEGLVEAVGHYGLGPQLLDLAALVHGEYLLAAAAEARSQANCHCVLVVVGFRLDFGFGLGWGLLHNGY